MRFREVPGGGKTGTKSATSSARRGVLPMRTMWACNYSVMGSPTKNWSKLLTHRSFAVRTLPQPATERCVMSYVDVFYWGLLLVAFLGFAAALFYFWQLWSNRNHQTGKQKI